MSVTMGALLAAIRHPVARLGVVLTTGGGLVFLGVLAVDLAGGLPNPYAGLVAFLALPLVFVAGLVLIPLGIWLERRRAPRWSPWPRVDLGQPDQRRLVAFLVLATTANVVILSLAAGGGVEYMETEEFCGQVCHEPMQPQLDAHQVGSHASVSCVACHIGPGTRSFVEAKVRGVRQLAGVVTGDFPRPIHPPVAGRRPVVEVCTECHSTGLVADRRRVRREFGDDEANTEYQTVLRFPVGGVDPVTGESRGIHWHADPAVRVDYVASDDHAETIPYVRVTDRDGTVTEYVADGADRDAFAGQPAIRMDCRDCHRPAHAVAPSAAAAVDRAIDLGQVDRSLPFVRREMVAALTADYTGPGEARDRIAAAIRTFYARDYPDLTDEQAAAAAHAARMAEELYDRNVFPSMQVEWGTYPDPLGHSDFPGCFRCHDETHRAGDGSVIGQECETCHTFE